MSEISQKQKGVPWDEMDEKIERGEIDPPENGFYTTGILNILNMLIEHKEFQRPKGKRMPIFTEKETFLLMDYIFFKPKGWRAPRPFPDTGHSNP